jgi:hypothetical protein
MAAKRPDFPRRTGATGLEPATSGVTGRFGCYDVQTRTAAIYVICRPFCALAQAVSAWLRRFSHGRLGHEWATGLGSTSTLEDEG